MSVRMAERSMGAGAMLRAGGMPLAEVRAVLSAESPEIARRHIELYVEWLEERLARQRRILEQASLLLRAPRISDQTARSPSDDRVGMR
jgi:hypothetical protein